MFSARTDARAFYRGMREMVERGFPQVVAGTLTQAAHLVDRGQQANLKKDFTLRNEYTKNSLFVLPANSSMPLARMNAIVGTRSPYLPIQESGGVERAKGKSLAMPTIAGRGGSKEKVIPIPLSIRAMGQIAGTSARLTKYGKRMRSKGFFILGPGPRLKQPAIFYRPKGGKLEKVRLLGHKTQKVKATHWHSDAVKGLTYAKMLGIYAKIARIVGVRP